MNFNKLLLENPNKKPPADIAKQEQQWLDHVFTKLSEAVTKNPNRNGFKFEENYDCDYTFSSTKLQEKLNNVLRGIHPDLLGDNKLSVFVSKPYATRVNITVSLTRGESTYVNA